MHLALIPLTLVACDTLDELLEAADAPEVSSTFDEDTEGWTVTGDAQGGSVEPSWIDEGGNPGGYALAEDDGTGIYWYWLAPTEFLGDKSAYLGTHLSFDLTQTGTDNDDEWDVVLAGADEVLVYDFQDAPGAAWTSFVVGLDVDLGWTDLDGVEATLEQVEGVLGGLESLEIRGEFTTGHDEGGLDNVLLGG